MDPTALGRYLRESREAKEITLEAAVRALRIRRDILEAFEQGDFTVLDSTVRIRGMLRNYAQYLSLDEERVLQYYEASLSDKRRGRFDRRRTTETIPVAPRKITDTPPALPAVSLPSSSSGGMGGILRNMAMLLVSVAALAVIGFVVLDTLDLRGDDDPAEADIAAASTVALGTVTITPTNTATVTPRATIITDTPNAAAMGIGVGVQVVMEVTQRSWIRISVDDVEQYAGFFEPGSNATYEANDTISITAANAAALDITYNGVAQDTFGTRGQEVELVFTTTGIESSIAPITTNTPVSPTSTTNPDGAAVTATQSSAANNAEPTSNIPTPTPLFADTQADTTAIATDVTTTATQISQDTQSQTTPTAPVNTQSDATATTLPAASTATTIPDTATPAAVLPPRETTVPSPTKPNP